MADAIADLQAARAAEDAADVKAMGAAEDVTAAEADVATVQAAVDATDTGPASETLAGDKADEATEGARTAFTLLMDIADADRSGDGSPTASHDGSAAKFTVTGWKQSAASMAPTIDGWASAMLTGKPSVVVGEEDGSPVTAKHDAEAIVYGNIEAPEMEIFANVYAGGTAPIVATETGRFPNVVIPPANEYVGSRIAGSYRGLEGTFTCSETCGTGPAARRTDGSIISMAGTWTFEPTDDEARVPVQDSDYLAFGYWLSKGPAGPSGFEVWYSGSKPVVGIDDSVAYDALDEKVTYSGVAGGKYVTKDELAATAAAGYFTATAELTATFKDGEDTEDSTNTLTGTISGFTDPDGGAPLNDLELTLVSAPIAYVDATGTAGEDSFVGATARVVTLEADAAADAESTTSVTAVLGGEEHKGAGDWEAELFGAEPNTNLPTGVVGSFDATVGERMTVMGGFAAEKRVTLPLRCLPGENPSCQSVFCGEITTFPLHRHPRRALLKAR